MTFIPLKEKFHLNAIPSEINVSCSDCLLRQKRCQTCSYQGLLPQVQRRTLYETNLIKFASIQTGKARPLG